jgi:hypothetical protein
MFRRSHALLATGALVATTTLLSSGALGPSARSDVTRAGSGSEHGSGYQVGLFGDMPYGAYGREKYPRVIADMNHTDLAFSIFDGDTKNGSEPCYADAHPAAPTSVTPDLAVADSTHPDVYRYALSLFDRFRDPVVYVPGDNEWTDCDRPSTLNGAISDSDDRLAYLRRLSYPTDRSLGQRTIRLIRQSPAFPENVRWSKGPVTFIALNIPGSDNNFADGGKNGPAAQGQAEYAARNAANLQWLREGFAAATADHSAGVMIVIQADMWDPSATLTHFADTKAELARQTIAFTGRVILVNGDSHSFETDKPLTDAATTNAAGATGANVIENFTRVTTFGEFQNHWVSATIDAHDPNVFRFEQHLIKANLPTYTTPPAP